MVACIFLPRSSPLCGYAIPHLLINPPVDRHRDCVCFLMIRNNKVIHVLMKNNRSFKCIPTEDGLSFSKQNNALLILFAKADE